MLTKDAEVISHDPSEWTGLAAFFAHSFALASIQPIDIYDQVKLKTAFLMGIQLRLVFNSDVETLMLYTNTLNSLRNPNDKNLAELGTPRILNKLKRKQASIGLTNASQLLQQELDGIKVQLMIGQKRFERRFEAMPSQFLLQDGVDADEIAEEDEDDNMDVYELEEDGMVL
jgi:hypothetical protein